jgi:anti-sigma factor ChrR (cupin superfamily)
MAAGTCREGELVAAARYRELLDRCDVEACETEAGRRFNNNPGGHWAGNAKKLMAMLGQYRGEPPWHVRGKIVVQLA